MNITAFRVQFPEFDKASSALVQAHLDAARLQMDLTVWGTLADQGQAYLAAHKLALSPFGQAARMVAADGKTTYWLHYQNLVRTKAGGPQVA